MLVPPGRQEVFSLVLGPTIGQSTLGQQPPAKAPVFLFAHPFFGGVIGVQPYRSCHPATTFVLGLGPTNPERTSLPQETLGIRRVRFSLTIRYSCRHSHFRPLQPSSRSTFT